MKFQIEGNTNKINAELVYNKGSGDLLFVIDDQKYNLKLLKSTSNEFEFILENTYHYVKILPSTETKYKIYIYVIVVEIKKHSKITEII
jgi:hypothetical protein